jgi:[acyl-carrier-protein] S-malonyltransferase
MAEAGVSTFIEFGPGRVLTGLVKRILPEARLINISNLADMSMSAKT